MKILGIILSYSIVAVAFVILATKIFYPHHRLIALGLYGVSWVFFLWAFWAKRQSIIASGEFVGSFVSQYGWLIFFGVVFSLFLYFYFVLFPPEKSSLLRYTSAELTTHMSEDRVALLYVNARLEEIVRFFEEDALFAPEAGVVTFTDRAHVREVWSGYVAFILELDLLKEKYKGFYQLNDSLKIRRDEGFLLAYNAFLSQNHFALRLHQALGDNADVQKILNDPDVRLSLPAGAYDRIVDQLSAPEEIVRLNAGRGYLSFIDRPSDDLVMLAQRRVAYVDHHLSGYTYLALERPFAALESRAFQTWFPLQKRVATEVSYIRTTDREYLISPAFAHARRDALLPGDLLFERREWHATNVGIPGYWTHGAFYLGTLDDIDAYFADLKEFDDQRPRDVLARLYPDAYAVFLAKRQGVYPMSVIEAKRPGVVFMSFEYSANADALGVLRPRVSREDKWQAVKRAFSFYGRAYDYDFDFRTENALVCSEVLYKAYEGSSGMTIFPETINGRPLVSPNAYVEKFASEMYDADRELDFVLMWDGNEKLNAVKEVGEDVFAASYKRPKWHILKDYVQ